MKATAIYNSETNKLLSVNQAAQYLNISRSTLLRLTYAGQLPSVTIISRRLYLPEDLDAWIQLNHGYMETKEKST